MRRWGHGGGIGPRASVGYGIPCFAPSALVTLADGTTVPVSSLLPGDVLRSPSGDVEVTVVYSDRLPKTWVSFNGLPAFVTTSHPVSTDRGFIPAGEVRLGDVLVMSEGRTLAVSEVALEEAVRPNINVETRGHAPYFVEGILFGSYPSYEAAKAASQGR